MAQAKVNAATAYIEYEDYGGPEGIDSYWYDQDTYIPDEDGEIAYEAMLDSKASAEQEIEDRALGIW
jgi:hypothetical protein